MVPTKTLVTIMNSTLEAFSWVHKKSTWQKTFLVKTDYLKILHIIFYWQRDSNTLILGRFNIDIVLYTWVIIGNRTATPSFWEAFNIDIILNSYLDEDLTGFGTFLLLWFPPNVPLLTVLPPLPRHGWLRADAGLTKIGKELLEL